MGYQISDVCKLGKRINNLKRNYLLVNPLQGKHIPASPTASYNLFRSLGDKLHSDAENADLIIGFAETATAVGAIAAMAFSDNTIYLHSTRETLDMDQYICFREEHSHAINHCLDSTVFSDLRNGTVILIDDEISSGNTAVNMINALKSKFPHMKNCRYIVGSIINRMSSDRISELRSEGIEFESLVWDSSDYRSVFSNDNAVEDPSDIICRNDDLNIDIVESSIPNLRRGMTVKTIKDDMRSFSVHICKCLNDLFLAGKDVAIIGTEECMTAAIAAGCQIENSFSGINVKTHSTTRSPIGISSKNNYPCTNGISLPSFYENGRKTYIYNIGNYDTVVVVTDSKNDQCTMNAMSYIREAFKPQNLVLVRG